MLGIGISNTVTVGQTSTSAASCLNKTMKLANAKQSLFMSYLAEYPKYWEFEDRIFCWLHPDYRPLIDNFYEKDGPTLKEVLPFDKINILDNECKNSLLTKLPKSPPIITDKQLLDEFYRVKKQLNCTPTLTELGEYGRYSQRLWHKRFGPYHSFLKSLGEAVKLNKITPQEECIKMLEALYLKKSKEIGRPPQIFEMDVWNPKEFDRAVNYYGGWKQFIVRMREAK